MSRDARHRTGRDADFRAGRRRRPLLHPRKSGNRPVRTRLLVVLGELLQTTAGKWITHPATRCPNGHTLDVGQVPFVGASSLPRLRRWSHHVDVPAVRSDGVRAATQHALHGAQWASDCADLDRAGLTPKRPACHR